jgi:hypothetical protein
LHLIFWFPIGFLAVIGFVIGLGVAFAVFGPPNYCPPGHVRADALCPRGYGRIGCL